MLAWEDTRTRTHPGHYSRLSRATRLAHASTAWLEAGSILFGMWSILFLLSGLFSDGYSLEESVQYLQFTIYTTGGMVLCLILSRLANRKYQAGMQELFNRDREEFEHDHARTTRQLISPKPFERTLKGP